MPSNSSTIVLLLIYLGIAIPSSMAISRSEIITRAQFWTQNEGIPYSQSTFAPDPEGAFYRTDCSGYVSMVWRLPTNETTLSLAKFSKQITKDELDSGDILLNVKGRHVVIFDKWTSSAKIKYWAYEQANYPLVNQSTAHLQIPYPYWPKSQSHEGYVPYRFLKIEPTTPSTSTTTPSAEIGKCKCPHAIGEGARDTYCGGQMSGSCEHSSVYNCIYQGEERPLLALETPCSFGCETIQFGRIIASGQPYYLSKCILPASGQQSKRLNQDKTIHYPHQYNSLHENSGQKLQLPSKMIMTFVVVIYFEQFL